MVQIKIKAVNELYTVQCAYDDIQEFLVQLTERLNACSEHGTRPFEAFFHFQQDVHDDEMMQIIQLANGAHTTILGFAQAEQKHDLKILEQDLYSGQTYSFDQEILLLGSIGADAFVSSSESMYCLGDVNGNIDLLHEDCILVASSFFQANIRICDTRYHNLTSFSPAKAYYKDTIVQLKAVKEERMWAKQ